MLKYSQEQTKRMFKLNGLFKTILILFFVLLLSIPTSVIHEFSHLIAVLITGNKFIKFRFYVSELNIHSFCVYELINQETRIFVVIAGSLGVLVFYFILIIIFCKVKKCAFLTNSFLLFVFFELMYWTISPVFGIGDSVNFFSLLGWSTNYISIFVPIIFGLLSILVLYFGYRINSNIFPIYFFDFYGVKKEEIYLKNG